MNNNVELREIREQDMKKGAVITVIGVGGGGNNMINHLIKTGTFSNINLIIANTDMQHMRTSPAKQHIVLGERTTKGLGAGMKPDVGKKAAEESYEDLKQSFVGSDLVIVSAGLGGGTGTGAAPVVAKAAKEAGALTVAIVTKPFDMEGRKRAKFAEEGLKCLREHCDCIVVIPNQKVLTMISKNTGYKESLTHVDEVLSRAVNGISSIILDHSQDGINVDFEDLRTVMSHVGLALLGIGEGEGEDAASNAVRGAIESPLFDNMSIDGAMGVVVNFEMNPDFPLYSITEAMKIIHEAASDDADIIFGTMPRDDFDINKIRVSIVATGFEHNCEKIQNTVPTQQSIEANNPNVQQSVSQDLFTAHQPDITFHKVKTSNGDYDSDDLDAPSYFRKMKD